MLKKLKSLSLLLIIALVLTGCDQSSAEKKLKDARDKMQDVNAANIKMKADVNMAVSGSNMSLIMSMDGAFQGTDKDAKTHMNMSVSLLGMEQKTEMYSEIKDDYIYNYVKNNDEWSYTKEKYTDVTINKQVADMLQEFTSVKEEKTDKKGYTKLKVVLNKDKVNKMLNSSLMEAMMQNKIDSLKISKDLEVTVYLKDGYISIMEFDLGDIFKDLAGEELKDTDVDFKLSIELSDFNQVDKITIPEDVKKNAKETDLKEAIDNV